MNRSTLRALRLAAAALFLASIWACVDPHTEVAIPVVVMSQSMLIPQPTNRRDVDLMFVLDNSQSMLGKQEQLRVQFMVLASEMENNCRGMPSVHIGVVSSDLGAGNYLDVPSCERFGGDGGLLGVLSGVDLAEQCIGPGQRYLVDVEPTGCGIIKDGAGDCSAHDCRQEHCAAVEGENESLTLVLDDGGCPRCRNYGGTLADALGCMVDLGEGGCEFEQPLEAMMRALNPDMTPENQGFVREDAFLGVIFISDEDDCSALKPEVLFDPDPAEDRIDSTLGFLHSFRCFEFGVTCDINGRETGPRRNCIPREDDQALLHPVGRYTSFLEAVKEPFMLMVAAVAGPYDGTAMVQLDSRGRPELAPSCTDSAGQGATPGVRLKDFIAHFNDPTAMDIWAYTSACGSDIWYSLMGTGSCPMVTIWEACFMQPVDGCRDGPEGTACSPCLPRCVAFDIENRGRETQKRLRIPWCGEVCRDGLCSRTDFQPCGDIQYDPCVCDPPLFATRFGHRLGCAPLYFDDALPSTDRLLELRELVPRLEPTCLGPECSEETAGRASACWYFSSETRCPFGVGFRVVRAGEPKLRTFVDVRCLLVPDTEQLCYDGRDNDQDCHVDCADPDCAHVPACQ